MFNETIIQLIKTLPSNVRWKLTLTFGNNWYQNLHLIFYFQNEILINELMQTYLCFGH
jgi:hypothetical protein